MPRMRFEAGIVHPCDRRVRREELRNTLGAVVLVAHPQRERLQSALEQERRVWIERAAEVIGAVADALDGRGIAHDRARDDVGVPVQVLGGAVQTQIEARGERPVVDGRREGVVDDRDQAVLAGELHHSFQVGDLQQRVRHGLDVNGARVGAQQRRPGIAPVGIDEVALDAEPRELPVHQVVRAAVQPALCQEVIAGREHREERSGDGRHAARRNECRRAAFEHRQFLVQCDLARGVVDPQVADVVVAAFARILEGCGLEDRHLDRAGNARQRLAGVHQLRLDVPEGFAHGELPGAIVT